MSSKQVESAQKFVWDKFLIAILVAFMVLSLASIYFSSYYLNLNTLGLVQKQAMWYAIGFGTLYLLTKLGFERLYNIMRLVYFVLLFMLIILIVVQRVGALNSNPLISRFIRPIKGAWAWYQFPGIGSFQPSEFMKITLLFISADVTYKHFRNPSNSGYLSDLRLFVKIGLWALPPLFLNFLQPDTGIPLIIVISLIFLLYVAGTKKLWFVLVAAGLVVLYVGVVYIYYNHIDILNNMFETTYRLRRFYGWLDYEKYSTTFGYQLNSSLMALGLGGPGGIDASLYNVRIPEAQNDFIFAVIGSRLGFVGTLFTISLCLLLNVKLMMVAKKSTNIRAQLIIAGLVGIFIYQQLQNIAMMIGLLPITGITLPLISYGGSSLLSYMIGLSVVFLASNHTANNPVYDVAKLPTNVLKQTS